MKKWRLRLMIVRVQMNAGVEFKGTRLVKWLLQEWNWAYKGCDCSARCGSAPGANPESSNQMSRISAIMPICGTNLWIFLRAIFKGDRSIGKKTGIRRFEVIKCSAETCITCVFEHFEEFWNFPDHKLIEKSLFQSWICTTN